jgi:hypothetical protein
MSDTNDQTTPTDSLSWVDLFSAEVVEWDVDSATAADIAAGRAASTSTRPPE